MKILVVSQFFYPENFRINNICSELVNRGNTVTVLTGYPNYPSGEFYDGYAIGEPYDEQYNGVTIKRVAMSPRKKGAVNLIKNYLSFAKNASRWVKKCNDEFDICYVYQLSPIIMAKAALAFKKKYKKPFAMSVQDLWPESLMEITGIRNKLILFPLNKMINKIYKQCDCIMCASKSFITKIKERNIPTNKLFYLPQYSEQIVSEKRAEEPSEYKTEIRLVFAGNIGQAQGLDIILDCAQKLKTNAQLGFYLIGDGRDKERLVVKANDMQLENVFFIDRKAEDEIPQYLAFADCALLCLKDNILSKITIPAKVQMYMYCKAPIISAIGGEAGNVINEANCGLVCSENSADNLAKTILEFIKLSKSERRQLGENGYKYNELNFNKDILINELEANLQNAINNSIKEKETNV